MASNAKLIEWVEHISVNAVNLTSWEETFIESMLDKISRYGDDSTFTPPQAEQIERIYSERTP